MKRTKQGLANLACHLLVGLTLEFEFVKLVVRALEALDLLVVLAVSSVVDLEDLRLRSLGLNQATAAIAAQHLVEVVKLAVLQG